jgi:hypothetical protein
VPAGHHGIRAEPQRPKKVDDGCFPEAVGNKFPTCSELLCHEREPKLAPPLGERPADHGERGAVYGYEVDSFCPHGSIAPNAIKAPRFWEILSS